MSDYPEFFRVKEFTAKRKDHKCCECRGKISIGEKYHYVSGVWHGEFEKYKICNFCYPLLEAFSHEYIANGNDPIGFGELYEAIFESNDKELMQKWIGNSKKRGAKVEQWMLDRLNDEEN